MPKTSITIKLNGETMDLPEPLSVADLLRRLELAPNRIAVAVNDQVVAADQLETHYLVTADQVEIIQFVGGG